MVLSLQPGGRRVWDVKSVVQDVLGKVLPASLLTDQSDGCRGCLIRYGLEMLCLWLLCRPTSVFGIW